MDFTFDARTEELRKDLLDFMDTHVHPGESVFAEQLGQLENPWAWSEVPVLAELRAEARRRGLWNLFLPGEHGAGLTNLQYAPLAEITGRSPQVAPEALNCAAPDTGNMELLHLHGTPEQQRRWLLPLLEAEIRSAFSMTEPDVASSDASNIALRMTPTADGGFVLDGRKWWSTGAGHPDCRVGIFMGLTDPSADRHRQHSMVVVPLEAPGVRVERMLTALGQYDEPLGHGEVSLTAVRLPRSAILAGPGRAFEIAQGRLGPGRVHHCMRLVGLAEKALELACQRSTTRVAFGKPIANLGGNRERIADARIAINRSRLLVMHAAWLLDQGMSREAYSAVSEIKVEVPNMALDVIDMAIQLHGGAGLSDDFPLAMSWVSSRALRLADGPDEVHKGMVARLELGKYS